MSHLDRGRAGLYLIRVGLLVSSRFAQAAPRCLGGKPRGLCARRCCRPAAQSAPFQPAKSSSSIRSGFCATDPRPRRLPPSGRFLAPHSGALGFSVLAKEFEPERTGRRGRFGTGRMGHDGVRDGAVSGRSRISVQYLLAQSVRHAVAERGSISVQALASGQARRRRRPEPPAQPNPPDGEGAGPLSAALGPGFGGANFPPSRELLPGPPCRKVGLRSARGSSGQERS
jgi:hypothetical protein